MKKPGILEAILFAAFIVCSSVYLYAAGTDGEYYDADGKYRKITGKKSFRYLENHPAFKEYKDYIIPWKDPLNKRVMPYLSLQSVCGVNHFSTKSVVNGFNFMLRMDQEGKNKYYHFYDSNETAAEQSKKDTGIIFIPGEINAPFALVVPGGGMTCIAHWQRGFPWQKNCTNMDIMFFCCNTEYHHVRMKRRWSILKNSKRLLAKTLAMRSVIF